MPEQQNIEFKQSWQDDYLKWIYEHLVTTVDKSRIRRIAQQKVFLCWLMNINLSFRSLS